MPLDKHGLTIKQRKFCDVYVKTANGTQAAKSAGYSKSCPGQIATENLKKPAIKKYVDMKMEEAVAKVGVGKDWRLEVLKKGIEISLRQKKDEDGCEYYPQLDLKGIKALVSEMNKMTGDHAPTTSNLNVSETTLEEAKEIADKAEKEINEIKTF